MEILHIYHRGLGQLVNRDKSAIFYSRNCTDEMKEAIGQVLDIQREALAERYLGLPTATGRNMNEVFEFLPAQVKGRIESWCGREASCAGREVLIKSIAQAVPTYCMSCFLLPLNVCKKMKTAVANYW